MEGKVNKVDNSRRRSSLRNPIDMKIEPKHKNLQFLDSIQEDNETVILFKNILIFNYT